MVLICWAISLSLEALNTVGNCDRSIGARLSGEIATRYGNKGMEGKPLTLNLEGVAGQSLGV